MIAAGHPLVRVSRLARPHAGRLVLGIAARRARDRRRHRPDGDVRLPHLAGRPAARRSSSSASRSSAFASSASRAASCATSSGSSRTTPRCARSPRVRARLFARLEPLVPAGLPGMRTGDLLGRFVADVDALQGLYLRALGRPRSRCSRARSRSPSPRSPSRRPVSHSRSACCSPASRCRSRAARLTRAAVRREAPARAALTAELLDALAAAPELVAYGAAPSAAARHRGGRRDARPARRRRTALVAAVERGGGDRARDARGRRRARRRGAAPSSRARSHGVQLAHARPARARRPSRPCARCPPPPSS